MKLLPQLQSYTESLESNISSIQEERRAILNALIKYLDKNDIPKLNFICTHNSRRSHLGQIWAQTAGAFYDLNVSTFSGGTEATAFNTNAIAALERSGFKIEVGQGTNPKCLVRFSAETEPLTCFSKKYDDLVNPSRDFTAIMTCSEADAECPIVFGATDRIKLLYEDPKVADGTPEEAMIYDERCLQIATEMVYVFSQLKSG